ncbi:MAG: hypothetical protein D6718_11540 [Acidobacteria bacterium]|nr:MAG: hypothetical protein D6718_11540 [Acidobacteriota bacterium]
MSGSVAVRGGERAPGRGLAAAALGLLAVAFLALAAGHRWYNDDAFITFRYARHIAQGHGFVWNVAGGRPVEGSSSLAWTLLNAAAIAGGLDPVVFSQAAGAAAGLAGLFLAYAAARRLLGVPRFAALVAPAVLVLQRQYVLWSVSALETQAATVLLFAATLLFVREVVRRRPGWPASGLLFFAGTLFRPEAPLVHLGAGAGLALVRRDRRALSAVVASGATHALLLGALTLVRLAYFGQPLPNTFYAKVGGVQLARGLAYLGQFFWQTNGWLWGPALAAGAGLALRREPPELRRATVAAILAQAVCWCAWIAVEGGGAWEFRFMDMLLPGLALLCALAVHGIAGAVSPSRRALAAAAAAAVVGAQAATLIVPFRPFGTATAGLTRRTAPVLVVPAEQLERAANEMLREGRTLAPFLTPEDRISIGWAGALPYVTDAWHLDPWGLNDPEIARRPFSEEATLYHQRHAEWSDMVERRVMFVDVFNQFLYKRPLLPYQVARPLEPWVKEGAMIYCAELPVPEPYRFWIFASPRPRQEVESWLRAKGLRLRYATPLVLPEGGRAPAR